MQYIIISSINHQKTSSDDVSSIFTHEYRLIHRISRQFYQNTSLKWSLNYPIGHLDYVLLILSSKYQRYQVH